MDLITHNIWGKNCDVMTFIFLKRKHDKLAYNKVIIFNNDIVVVSKLYKRGWKGNIDAKKTDTNHKHTLHG